MRQLGGGLLPAAAVLAALVWFLTAVSNLEAGRQNEGRAQLEDAIRRGILQKPQRHHLAEGPSDTPRTMNQIGG